MLLEVSWLNVAINRLTGVAAYGRNVAGTNHGSSLNSKRPRESMANNTRDVDYEITRLLQQNGRIPNTEIAKKLKVSEATVRNRLQKMIKDGQIQVVAIVNPLQNRAGILGNVKIKAEKAKLDQVGEALESLEGLWYIAQLSGATDFDLEFFVDTQKEFGKLVSRIHKIDGVIEVETSLTVRFLKNNWRFGIPGI